MVFEDGIQNLESRNHTVESVAPIALARPTGTVVAAPSGEKMPVSIGLIDVTGETGAFKFILIGSCLLRDAPRGESRGCSVSNELTAFVFN